MPRHKAPELELYMIIKCGYCHQEIRYMPVEDPELHKKVNYHTCETCRQAIFSDFDIAQDLGTNDL